MDNGSELTSRHFLAWGIDRRIELVHIQPGKPVQNAYIESFHGRLRDECLNTTWFQNLWEARRKIDAWRHEYNHERPHSSLAYRTPAEFAATLPFAVNDPNTASRIASQGFPSARLRSTLTLLPLRGKPS